MLSNNNTAVRIYCQIKLNRKLILTKTSQSFMLAFLNENKNLFTQQCIFHTEFIHDFCKCSAIHSLNVSLKICIIFKTQFYPLKICSQKKINLLSSSKFYLFIRKSTSHVSKFHLHQSKTKSTLECENKPNVLKGETELFIKIQIISQNSIL